MCRLKTIPYASFDLYGVVTDFCYDTPLIMVPDSIGKGLVAILLL